MKMNICFMRKTSLLLCLLLLLGTAEAQDSISPTVVITYPYSSQIVFGMVTINASAFDNIAVDQVEFYVDSKKIRNDISPPYYTTWNAFLETNTTHLLKVIAYDTSGNINSHSITVIVDESRKKADLNNDGKINLADVIIIILSWGSAEGDINKDGITNLFDIGILLSKWASYTIPASPTISGVIPNSATQGTTLQAIITGTNLDQVNSILFSGTGVTGLINPGGTSTTAPVTINIGSAAPTGLRVFAVSTPNGIAQSGNIAFEVKPLLPASFDFLLTNSGSITLTQGNSGSNTITANLLTGISELVSLFVSGLPPGSTYTLTPQSGTPPFTSTLTITTASTTPTGTYPIIVTGTSLSLTKTTSFTLAINQAFQPCILTSASIVPVCSGGSSSSCETGESVTMSGTYTGSCEAADFFQIDASTTGCTVKFSGGDMSGISDSTITIIGGTVSGSWVTPTISSQCTGKTVTASAAALYDGGPPGTGTWLTGTTATGTINFATPIPPTGTYRLTTDLGVPANTAIDVSEKITSAIGNLTPPATVILEGIYFINHSVRIWNTNDITILGSGDKTGFVRYQQDVDPADWAHGIPWFSYISIRNSSRITLQNFNITGPLKERKYNSSIEQSHAFSIGSAAYNVIIKDINVTGVNGDVLRIGGSSKEPKPSFITMERVNSKINGRQGIALVWGEFITIRNVTIELTARSGIDVEPLFTYPAGAVSDVLIEDSALLDYKNIGVGLHKDVPSYRFTMRRVTFRGGLSLGKLTAVIGKEHKDVMLEDVNYDYRTNYPPEGSLGDFSSSPPVVNLSIIRARWHFNKGPAIINGTSGQVRDSVFTSDSTNVIVVCIDPKIISINNIGAGYC